MRYILISLMLTACSGESEPDWVKAQNECDASGGYSKLDIGEDIETGDTVIIVGCIL